MSRNIPYLKQVDKKIGQKIKLIRITKGLSRQQLADKIQVTHQQLQKYEKGTNRITAGRLAMLANSLNISIGDFLEDHIEETGFSGSRLDLEISRNFMRIKNQESRVGINNLVRIMSKNQ